MNRRQLVITASAAMALPAYAKAESPSLKSPGPQIIAHRGASGYLPEHTLAAYEAAVRMGADHIEPDVVATKDGHLVVRHDPVLTDSTDILSHPEFADRKRTVSFGTFEITDFFVSDFTLAEIKTLRARQVFADRSHADDDRYEIPTLQEVLGLRERLSRESGRTVGIVPEIKFPTLHRQVGLAIEEKLVDMLDRAGLNSATAPVWIQSFEQANLKALKKMTPIKLLQLVSGSDVDPTGAVTLLPPDDKPYDWVVSGRAGTYADMLTQEGLDEVATYAAVVSPWKRWLVSFSNGQPVVRKDIVDNAHARGLQVFTWTLRNDRLDPFYAGDPAAEYTQLFHMGVDGVFSDFPDTAVAARDKFAQ
ncbi:glycerophosphodiester phosphodiesterase family protein [Asticcacaulis sp. AC402]|uniref:glycerophosphodiester phosphodiesterase family protein n=1 Tax=Asticcacaulis sp. AC402 TaxID=1282361 RepID=UPI0003C3F558|nr:glycerophosphodiester phosphodiesterase family protein [Asticcacaulis sp. AC402]ESQ75982.1 glycerophosphoryl diester phosphodiesterase [Asticcacaulis sp. AC402]